MSQDWSLHTIWFSDGGGGGGGGGGVTVVLSQYNVGQIHDDAMLFDS